MGLGQIRKLLIMDVIVPRQNIIQIVQGASVFALSEGLSISECLSFPENQTHLHLIWYLHNLLILLKRGLKVPK